MVQSKSKMKKIAVIGASSGQLPIVKKAKEKELEVHCFAWDEGAICKSYSDFFYPISIFETNQIIDICKDIGLSGVVSNASEETALATAIVAERLGLNGTSSDTLRIIQNKKLVREITAGIEGLSSPHSISGSEVYRAKFPCVVKPVKGSAKKGVTFCNSPKELEHAIEYAKQYNDDLIAEEYIEGEEYSVESISYHGKHHVIQITKKITSGYPHFIELEHHQPAQIPDELRERILKIIDRILSVLRYSDGASHIEIKINGDNIYLIEINPRGGGDRISDTLVGMSTDCDYLGGIIDVSLNAYVFKPVKNLSYAGILFLNKQNSRIEKYFECPIESWMVERHRSSSVLTTSLTNYDRNGYIIYKTKEPLKI